MGDSFKALTADQDVEQGKNTPCDQGNTDRDDIKELFRLLDERDWGDETQQENKIQKIRSALKKDKTLLTIRFKTITLIHAAKYNKIDNDCKQSIVNTIVDIGYELFQFTRDSVTNDNFYALFFVAAKGDYEKLKEIVAFFKIYDETKIYDTICEGDTVLSFMIKFGDLFQERFLDCFTFMVLENIDVERVDYFNNNLCTVIEAEIDYLNKVGGKVNYISKLKEAAEIVKWFHGDQDINSGISGKYKLFQALIQEDENFPKFLNKQWVDADDGGNTILQLAIIQADLKITKELLRKGANPNHITESGNKEVPLVLAAKLARVDIFREILENGNIKITNTIFSVFVTEVDSMFLNYLLESDTLDINVHYKGKTPLFYAISRKNRTAVQSLLRKGSRLSYNHLQNINPKDLEGYLNFCIKHYSFVDDMEENQYKLLLVFDLFINSSQCGSKSEHLPDRTATEVAIIRHLGENKRLKYLLEHPLVSIYIILKWHCVKMYYVSLLLLKFVYYIILGVLPYTTYFNIATVLLFLPTQGVVVLYEYYFQACGWNLNFILDIVIYVCLNSIIILTSVNIFKSMDVSNIATQIYAVTIIFASLSILLTIGYHLSLSKWMAMAKRVFKNFITMLLFFTIPIIGFAISFRMLNSLNQEKQESQKESNDFDSLPRTVFRILVMLGGDIGDKKFSAVGGYVVFIFFTIIMAIILLNFWTGVAVSDIKEIEEQSTIVAYRYVVVFIDGVERMHKFFCLKVFQSWLFPRKFKIMIKNIRPQLLKSKIHLNEDGTCKTNYGLDLYINSETQFKNPHFKNCKIPNDVISKIKTIFEEKDAKPVKYLNELTARLESLDTKLNEIRELLENKINTSQEK